MYSVYVGKVSFADWVWENRRPPERLTCEDSFVLITQDALEYLTFPSATPPKGSPCPWRLSTVTRTANPGKALSAGWGRRGAGGTLPFVSISQAPMAVVIILLSLDEREWTSNMKLNVKRLSEAAGLHGWLSLLTSSALWSGRIQQPFSCVTSRARAHMSPTDPANTVDTVGVSLGAVRVPAAWVNWH